jgi:hypothetical protein
MGSRDDILRQACIWALHQRLAGKKEWALFNDGPHLLFHWQQHELVLDRMTRWIDQRIKARTAPAAEIIAMPHQPAEQEFAVNAA